MEAHVTTVYHPVAMRWIAEYELGDIVAQAYGDSRKAAMAAARKALIDAINQQLDEIDK